MCLKKCNNCGRLFATQNNQDRNLCPNCFQEEREKFRLVRDYLWDHQGASIKKIAQETDVKQKTIRRFIREGRFDRG
ncbi:hypothetical protein JCM16358_02460 [Halanaerocella petrolearia]